MLNKALIIAQKDVLIRLRDRSGFAFLIITPLVLTFIMGLVFGGDEPLNVNIPVALINHDSPAVLSQVFSPVPPEQNTNQLHLGQIVVNIFTSEELADILTVTVVDDEAPARAAIDAGEVYCCLVVVPPNFSANVLAQQEATLTVYTDPAQAISAQIVTSIVRQITSQLAASTVLFEVNIEQLMASGRIEGWAQAEAVGKAMAADLEAQGLQSLLGLEVLDVAGQESTFDPLAFFAPSMAIIFLAFGAAQASRTILEEEASGTFRRLNTSPVSGTAILLGKVLGTLFSSGLQFAVLLIASTLLFGLAWGKPLAVTVVSLFIILAFTCLGLVMAVIARDENQAGVIGFSVLLIFVIISGHFSPPDMLPEWLLPLSRLTPNYWGLQSFWKLGLGQGLPQLGGEIVALTMMSLLFFAVGWVLYRRRVAV